MPSACLERGKTRPPADVAYKPGRDDDQREGHVEEKERYERCRRDGNHDVVFQRPTADPEDRLDDDGEDAIVVALTKTVREQIIWKRRQ